MTIARADLAPEHIQLTLDAFLWRPLPTDQLQVAPNRTGPPVAPYGDTPRMPFVLALKLGEPRFQVRCHVLGCYRFYRNRVALYEAQEYPDRRYLAWNHRGVKTLFGEKLSKPLQ